MTEKFIFKDAKKGDFNGQMEFRKRSIILFGFKGCGKTYYGKRVAALCGWVFKDTDILIEDLYMHRTGTRLSCRDICLKEGWPFFRSLEKEVVQCLRADPYTVLAVGGGTVLDADSCKHLENLGVLVYLSVGKDALKLRMEKDPPLYCFDEVYEHRKSIYENISAITIHAEQDEIVLKKIIEVMRGK